jgi:hypothetical protein
MEVNFLVSSPIVGQRVIAVKLLLLEPPQPNVLGASLPPLEEELPVQLNVQPAVPRVPEPVLESLNLAQKTLNF